MKVRQTNVCNTEQDVDRIHRTDATELEVVENIRCYYLILGTIVQVIKEDPARGMSEMRSGSITTPLWRVKRVPESGHASAVPYEGAAWPIVAAMTRLNSGRQEQH